MRENVVEDVFHFTAEHWHHNSGSLTLSTSLLDDLRMDGDDAVDFLRAFSAHFGVDMSRLDFGLHFSSEGGPDLMSLLTMVGMPMHVPITLSDLVAAAESGVWYEK